MNGSEVDNETAEHRVVFPLVNVTDPAGVIPAVSETVAV